MKKMSKSLLNPLRKLARHRLFTAGIAGVCVAGALVACGSGGGGSGLEDCDFAISSQPQSLSAAEVEQLLAQAVEASQKLSRNSTIAVTDRVGNVLGVYRMAGATANVTVQSGRPGANGGLETASVPSELAAIAKAVTGAYLSSSGNAFSTRTASFIVQEHFVPGIKDSNGNPLNTPSGPLFGVQFSQLPCGDFVKRGPDITALNAGPKRSPLGLAADPGGFPLYKNGRVVGGIGVVTDGTYGLDLNPRDFDNDLDERIAQSAASGFAAPACIRAERISLGGITAPYSDSDERLVSVSATTLADPSELIDVPGYITGGIRAGTAYGDAGSGIVPAQSGSLQTRGAYVFVDASRPVNLYPAMDAPSGGLTENEVSVLLDQALSVANQTRAQIRQPVGSPAQVTISIVDLAGVPLGIARTPDAPVFGADVSLQKARSAAFFSSATAAGDLARISGAPPYLASARTFFSDPDIFANGTAFSARAIGNIARPFYPDGIESPLKGPLSTARADWSPFNVGLQLDMVTPSFLNALLNPTAAITNCVANTGPAITRLGNGIQIFPGGVPIYRNDGILLGAIGVSGDGVDQDDMIAALGLKRAGGALMGAIGNATPGIRADTLNPPAQRLRYVQCPQAPFNNSSEQNVCGSL